MWIAGMTMWLGRWPADSIFSSQIGNVIVGLFGRPGQKDLGTGSLGVAGELGNQILAPLANIVLHHRDARAHGLEVEPGEGRLPGGNVGIGKAMQSPLEMG
jgi:hypothetical protein